MWTFSVERPKKHWTSFGFSWVMANIYGGDVAWVACVKCENPGALLTFPKCEGVLAIEIGEDKIGGTDDGVHKSIADDDSGPALVLRHLDDLGLYPIPPGPS